MFALCAEENALTPALSRRTGEGEVLPRIMNIDESLREARAQSPSVGWQRIGARAFRHSESDWAVLVPLPLCCLILPEENPLSYD